MAVWLLYINIPGATLTTAGIRELKLSPDIPRNLSRLHYPRSPLEQRTW